MKCSTDFSKPKTLKPVCCRLWLCLVLVSCLTAQTSHAQNCQSAQHNLQVAQKYQSQIQAELQAAIDAWNERYAEVLGPYEAGDSTDSDSDSEEAGSLSDKKSGKMGPPVDVKIDDSGKERYYVGIVNDSGELTGWEEVDYDPRNKKTSELKDSELSDNLGEALERNRRREEQFRKGISAGLEKSIKIEPLEKGLALAQALVQSVSKIPCDTYIKDINCQVGRTGAKECIVTFENIKDGGSSAQAKENKKLQAFYDALKELMQASENREKNVNPTAAATNSGKTDKEKNVNRPDKPVGEDYRNPQQAFMNNRDLSKISGEAIDENRDGKIDHIEVESTDGTATTFYDDDGDGRLDWLAKDNADGTSTLLIDTNNDGIPDKRVEQDRDGKTTYFPINPTATGAESRQSAGSVETKSEARNNPDLPSETTNNLKDLAKMTKEANKAANALKSLADLSYESNPAAAPPEPSASLGAIKESLKNAKKVSEGLTTASRIRDVIENPESTERRFDLAKDLYNRGVNAVGGVAGAAVKQYASDVPNLISDVNNAALRHLGSTMDPNSNYNPDMVAAPVINWIAKPMRIDKPGTRALDYQREGQLNWGELRQQYGWIEGTKRAVWYHLIDDLRKER